MSKTTAEKPIIFSREMADAIIAGRKTQTRRIVTPQPIDNTTVDGNFFEGNHKGYVKVDGHPNWAKQFAYQFARWQPGDILYVWENWKMVGWDFEESEVRIRYADGKEITFATADDSDEPYMWIVKQFEKLTAKDIIAPVGNGDDEEEPLEFTGKKHPFSPSIHLPKWCSRIWLEVVSVRVERLHDISKEDAIAEGILQDEIGFKDYDLKRAEGYGHPDVDYPHVQDPRHSYLSLWEKINGFESRNSNPWVWVIEFKVLTTEGEID